jgi:hypothetical protein
MNDMNEYSTIDRNEVQGVRDNIAEYVAFSNQQFAAENDFVKYQLAGTFTLLGYLTIHASNSLCI